MKTFKKFISELYQEEPGGTFESDGKLYDINIIFQKADKLPIREFNVSDLIWIFEDFEYDRRVDEADLNIPILVYNRPIRQSFNRLLVVDGEHRLKKAMREGIEKLPGKLLTTKIMQEAFIKNAN